SVATRPIISYYRRVYLLPIMFLLINHPSPTEINTLSLHDALPICPVYTEDRKTNVRVTKWQKEKSAPGTTGGMTARWYMLSLWRSEEHTSELQSRFELVCRLLLDKTK